MGYSKFMNHTLGRLQSLAVQRRKVFLGRHAGALAPVFRGLCPAALVPEFAGRLPGIPGHFRYAGGCCRHQLAGLAALARSAPARAALARAALARAAAARTAAARAAPGPSGEPALSRASRLGRRALGRRHQATWTFGRTCPVSGERASGERALPWRNCPGGPRAWPEPSLPGWRIGWSGTRPGLTRLVQEACSALVPETPPAWYETPPAWYRTPPPGTGDSSRLMPKPSSRLVPATCSASC